ncbi:hypothetical protein OEA_13120 [Priestia megaterium NCT-2]|uniref:hypothetical protein n=1 Tax=Priestia megaterium TaxID=1404 RepID=UPI000EB74358|nr:hypothetical protein [Priestia megaterium]AYE50680.1 hypothetical protein OEA_13120 [Priestia megaterium NCT-2]
MNIYFEGEWIECKPLLETDYEIKEILNILDNINNDDKEINLKNIGISIFHLASSPSCLHQMGSIQIRALANLGYVLFSEDEKSISRRHLYEKVLLAFFIPHGSSKNV